MTLKRIIFPFFNIHHDFLMHKVWFRLLIIIYIVVIFSMFTWVVWQVWDNYFGFYGNSSIYHSLSDRCYSDLDQTYQSHLLQGIPGEFNFDERHAECKMLWESELSKKPKYLLSAVISILLLTLFTHYIIQLIFFKVVVDFIVLGRKAWPKT